MPYVVRPRRVRTIIGSLLAAGAMLALPAAASAACATSPTTTPFARFGDGAQYALAPAGAFESGATGWALKGAATAGGNESYKVHGPADVRSLAIQPTGSAVSPAFCVDIARPSFRFFARRTSGTWGNLAVRLRWKDGSGVTHDTTVGALDGAGTSWQVSVPFALSTALPLWNGGQNATVQLVFDPEDYGGAWAIDDVYIDPYVRG